jgi:ELWxxDGT repeat protein
MSRFGVALRLGCSVAALLASAAKPSAAQPAYRVADLGDAVPYRYSFYSGPFPEHLEVGGKFFFLSDDGVHGRELWRSDGTALGTFLVRDLCPGTCGTRFPAWNAIAALGNRVLFAADDGVHGVELWISDGTAVGTSLVADLVPGYASSFIQNLTSAGGQAFFTALGDGGGSVLWRTDGTTKGTYAITPPGVGSSFEPTSIHPAPGFLYLCNANWAGQSGLWRSDGSSAGTTFLAAVDCWQNSFGKRGMMTVSPGGVLFFQGSLPASNDEELWRSDGTPAGTYLVKDLQPGTEGSWPSGMTWLGDVLIFNASGAWPNPSIELWRSDGTEAGTVPIPLADGARPDVGWRGAWTVAADRYYFAAYDDSHGGEPWVYDGLVASRVADLVPGPGSSITSEFPLFYFPYFEAFGSEALFTATDGVHGTELWRTDGSAGGTVRVSDIAPGAAGLHLPVYWASSVASFGGRPVVIEHQPESGERLWRLSPSGSAMELVETLDGQTSAFERRGTDRYSLFESEQGSDCFQSAGSRLFFERRRVGDGEIDLFRTDGAISNPEEILPSLPWRDAGACGSLGDRLLYPKALGPSPSETELVAIDATTGQLELLLASGAELTSQPTFLDLGERVAFGATFGLFSTDGTASGSTLLATDVQGFGLRIDAFLGEVAAAGAALWITDPKQLSGRILLPEDPGNLYVAPEIASLGPMLLFLVWDSPHGGELWVSDGTAEGTALLVDAVPGPDSLFQGASGGDRYVEYNDAELVGAETFAVLAGQSAKFGEELWVTDGTVLGTGLLKDIYPGDYPSTPRQLTRLGNRIVFSAEDEDHGLELWVTDGTFSGTTLLKDVAPGLASSVPNDLVVRDGTLYFSAWSPNYGREAWKSDGTAAGTMRISDVAPGPLSSSPQRFARAGNRLYFSATDQVHGYELWAISDDGSVPLFLDGFESSDTLRWSEVLP